MGTNNGEAPGDQTEGNPSMTDPRRSVEQAIAADDGETYTGHLWYDCVPGKPFVPEPKLMSRPITGEHLFRTWARENGFVKPEPKRPTRPLGPPPSGEGYEGRVWRYIEGIAQRQAALGQGSRNHDQNVGAYKAFRLAIGAHIPLDRVEDLIFDAQCCNGQVADDGERQVRGTMGSARGAAERMGPEYLPEGGETYGDAYSFEDDAQREPLGERPEREAGLRIDTIRGAETYSRTAEFVWAHGGHGRIQRGTLSLFGGRPGSGKSTCSRWVAAGFTRGGLEGCWHGKPQNIAYIGAEESLEYTVVPGLRAAGADMDHVFFPIVRDDEDNEIRLLSLRDERLLGDWLIDLGITVLIVDPLMSTISGKTDINRNNEVRSYIEPWARIAERIDGVVIGIAHLNKAPTGDVVAGINGSSAFGEVARSVFGFAKDPDSDDGERVMSQAKNSTGPEDLSLAYRLDTVIVTNDDMGRSEVARFTLLGDSDRSVSDVLRGGMERTDDDAVCWLRDYLTLNGRTLSKDVKRDAYKDAGHSERTIQRAAGKLRVVTERVGFQGQTYWSVPVARANTDGATGATGATGAPGEFSLDNCTDQGPSSQSRQSRQSGHVYTREDGTTGSAWPE